MDGDFKTAGYRVARGVVSDAELALLETYVLRLCQHGEGAGLDDQVPGGLSMHADPLFDALLFRLVGTIGELSGLDLAPTYSFARVYLKGAVLDRHVDRPACEVSATLCVALEPHEPWPICLDAGGEVEVHLSAGDLLLYKGCEVPHWREAFAGRACIQVFLHYVDRHGPHADHAFDAVRDPSVGRPRALPAWQDAEDHHLRLTVHRELVAEQRAAKEPTE